MRSLGKFHIGNNQAGKGDRIRPSTKMLDKKLFMTQKQKEKFESGLGDGTHCMICSERIYIQKFFSFNGKSLVVGNCCKEKIYKKPDQGGLS